MVARTKPDAKVLAHIENHTLITMSHREPHKPDAKAFSLFPLRHGRNITITSNPSKSEACKQEMFLLDPFPHPSELQIQYQKTNFLFSLLMI